MTTVDPQMALPSPSRRSLRHAAPLLLGPIVVYAVVRPLVPSSAVALGIAGAIPVLYSVVVAVVRRRIDLFAVVSGLGFSVAALVSVLTGAVELSTSSYLVVSRVVNWGTIVLGVGALAAYRRRLSARA